MCKKNLRKIIIIIPTLVSLILVSFLWDNINFNYGSHFKMMDLNILTGSEKLYSWQGWTSSYNPAHFDHIIITKPLFTYVDSSIIGVIDTPMETGLSLTRVSNTISDHKPVFFSFTIN